MKKILYLIQQNKYIAMAVIIFILMVISNIFVSKESNKNQLPDYKKTTEQKTHLSADGLDLGVSKIQDAQNKYGNFESIPLDENLTLNKFSIDHAYDPAQIITNKEGVIQAVLNIERNIKINALQDEIASKKLGNPDFVMFLNHNIDTKVYVFLNSGLAFEAATKGEIFHRITFVPTTKENFLKMFGYRYSEKYNYSGF